MWVRCMDGARPSGTSGMPELNRRTGSRRQRGRQAPRSLDGGDAARLCERRRRREHADEGPDVLRQVHDTCRQATNIPADASLPVTADGWP